MAPEENQKQSKELNLKDSDSRFKKSLFFKGRSTSDGKDSPQNSKSKAILVLDLDETLAHSFTKITQEFDAELKSVQIKSSEKTATYWVAKRPGLEDFLQNMSKLFEVVIYTTSVREYAETIIEELGMKPYISRVFHRGHCGRSANIHVKLKDLELVGSDFERMILIDDSITQTRLFPENSILIPPFRGNQEDRWLNLLTPFLQKVVTYGDFRSVSQSFSTYMMECELAKYSAVKLRKNPNKAIFDEPSSEAVSDDTCLDDIEDGITESALFQIMDSASLVKGSEKRQRPKSF